MNTHKSTTQSPTPASPTPIKKLESNLQSDGQLEYIDITFEDLESIQINADDIVELRLSGLSQCLCYKKSLSTTNAVFSGLEASSLVLILSNEAKESISMLLKELEFSSIMMIGMKYSNNKSIEYININNNQSEKDYGWAYFGMNNNMIRVDKDFNLAIKLV